MYRFLCSMRLLPFFSLSWIPVNWWTGNVIHDRLQQMIVILSTYLFNLLTYLFKKIWFIYRKKISSYIKLKIYVYIRDSWPFLQIILKIMNYKTDNWLFCMHSIVNSRLMYFSFLKSYLYHLFQIQYVMFYLIWKCTKAAHTLLSFSIL